MGWPFGFQAPSNLAHTDLLYNWRKIRNFALFYYAVADRTVYPSHRQVRILSVIALPDMEGSRL